MKSLVNKQKQNQTKQKQLKHLKSKRRAVYIILAFPLLSDFLFFTVEGKKVGNKKEEEKNDFKVRGR